MFDTRVVEFEMPVWRIIPFSDQPCLALELRDSDRLAVKFAAVNVSESALSLRPVAAPEPWWLGLQAGAHKNLYVHLLQQQPEVGNSGILAISAESGEKIWQKDGFAFQEISNGQLLVKEANNSESEIFALNPGSGTVEKRQTPDHKNKKATETSAEAHYPVTYLPENPHYTTLSTFLQLKMEVEPSGPMEYLETDRHIIFSIHVRQEKGLANYLVIFANNGHLRAQICLAGNLPGYSSDTFLLFCGKIIALQDSRKLLLIDLENK